MTLAQTSLVTWADISTPPPRCKSYIENRQAEILEFIRDNPGLTAHEIAAFMGHGDPNAVRPRITEMERADPPLVYYGPDRPDGETGRPAYTIYPVLGGNI